MKIEDYIKSLPEKIITGEDVQLSASTLREILEFADIGGKDVFYHLGCGDGAGPAIAAEYGARAIGIDADSEKIKKAEKIAVFSWFAIQMQLLNPLFFAVLSCILSSTVANALLVAS